MGPFESYMVDMLKHQRRRDIQFIASLLLMWLLGTGMVVLAIVATDKAYS